MLIGILLPALGRARELAKRTACLSNLREVYLSVRLYANDNRDAVLIGYRKNRSFNTTLFSNSANPPTYTLFGWLYPAGYMKQGRVWFCPSETNPKYMFNTPENVWPPGPPANPADPAKLTNAGYGCRPLFELADTGPGVLVSPPVDADRPRLRLSGWRATQAMYADTLNSSTKLATRHRMGVNVLYGDGHAAWIDRGQFYDFYKGLPPEPTLAPVGMDTSSMNQVITAVWYYLDVR